MTFPLNNRMEFPFDPSNVEHKRIRNALYFSGHTDHLHMPLLIKYREGMLRELITLHHVLKPNKLDIAYVSGECDRNELAGSQASHIKINQLAVDNAVTACAYKRALDIPKGFSINKKLAASRTFMTYAPKADADGEGKKTGSNKSNKSGSNKSNKSGSKKSNKSSSNTTSQPNNMSNNAFVDATLNLMDKTESPGDKAYTLEPMLKAHAQIDNCAFEHHVDLLNHFIFVAKQNGFYNKENIADITPKSVYSVAPAKKLSSGLASRLRLSLWTKEYLIDSSRTDEEKLACILGMYYGQFLSIRYYLNKNKVETAKILGDINILPTFPFEEEEKYE